MKNVLSSSRIKAFTLTILLVAAVFTSAVTLAYFTDTTSAISNTFSIAEITTHIDETTGQGSGGLWQKSPKIVNDGPSAGFIRARITVSPDLWNGGTGNNKITLKFGSWNGGTFNATADLSLSSTPQNGWIYGGDGYYYYQQVVASGFATNSLFDAVLIGSEVIENFDITIYQEAVVTKSTNSVESLADLKAAFAAVN